LPRQRLDPSQIASRQCLGLDERAAHAEGKRSGPQEFGRRVKLFVHRNVSNVVVHTDLNCLSVLQFAVDVLGVQHVIVCGHYGCGGVLAALRGVKLGLIDNWLRHVQDVASKHRADLDGLADERARAARLCELNVIEQVRNVGDTTVVRDAWRRGQELAVHGWIYDIHDGLLRDLGVTLDRE
jgi:carbonic anhydrase